jgi:hypothetical protein
MTILDNQIECKKCGQAVKSDEMLEHIILNHKDYDVARLLGELTCLASLHIVGGTNN